MKKLFLISGVFLLMTVSISAQKISTIPKVDDVAIADRIFSQIGKSPSKKEKPSRKDSIKRDSIKLDRKSNKDSIVIKPLI